MYISLEPLDWDKPIIWVNPTGVALDTGAMATWHIELVSKNMFVEESKKRFNHAILLTRRDELQTIHYTDDKGYSQNGTSIVRQVFNYLEEALESDKAGTF